ncbi:hypothetical protein ABPG77_009188 [Micractinium sp. CCAP 211/92]
MQRVAAASLTAALRRAWQSFASSSSATLSESLWLGTRDSRTRRGKIFKGSNGKSRPRKAAVNPWARPPAPQQIPIPYPPGWQPAGIGSGAAAALT